MSYRTLICHTEIEVNMAYFFRFWTKWLTCFSKYYIELFAKCHKNDRMFLRTAGDIESSPAIVSFAFRWEKRVVRALERSPREREVVGSIPGRDRLQSLKLVAVAFPLGSQDYGNSTTTGAPVSG